MFAAELKRIAYTEYEHLPRLLHKSFRTEGSHLTDAFFSHLIIIGERKQNTDPCLKVLLGIHCHKCGLILILLNGFTKEVILHLPELPEQGEPFVLQLRHHTVIEFIVRVTVFQPLRPTAGISSRSIKRQEIFQPEQRCAIGTNGATLFGLKDFLTLYASGGYTRSWSEGLEYSHTYDEFYYSVMAQLQYKGFSLLGQFRKVQNNFFGETIKKNENQTAFMAMYAKQNFQAGIGVLFPFTNNYKVGKERISEVAPFRSETFVKETGQMFILRVGYTFEFGRKHKAGNKGLNNSDTDSGIIDMQR